ncbi:glycosyltransferase [Allosphingosinicella flava]|uniref:Glycosyltransferase n=1 Tax=Allosphingosinicella flava TaxID=2771430 RepID=A0A7T2GJH5_9SPHN|nr:cellulose synthase catalytic subunit [Sphingosinicella flava]QPQ54981.1 glycosyltransferase [Sphingosinicella flava]
MNLQTGFYFEAFEDRRPPAPLPHNVVIESLWQFCATVALALGGWYIWWRWTQSLNFDALWFALPLVIAETCAYFGMILFVYNIWAVRDYPKRPAPATIGDCDPDAPEPERPVSVDIFIATYNEDEELVRLSIRDAMRIEYPHPIDMKVHVLDDGRRARMREVAEEEGANYISRDNNIGFKAGNLRNAMEQTAGDFILICDADTRPFPTILEKTLGFFRDPKVGFVQTPQWFYDLPEGETLTQKLGRRLGRPGRFIGRVVEGAIGELRIGEDPFVNDPGLFFDIIQRRRNRANAAFCCGAASLHRREAVMFVALRAYGQAIAHASEEKRSLFQRLRPRRQDPQAEALALWQAAQAQELMPYKFHVSEDIYTSIVLHQDRERGWKSVLSPEIQSKMLSPQDLLTWTIQRFKYAGGSLDILFHDNPLFRRGLTVRQRLMYLSTFWSYLGAVWNFIFLAAPIVYLFSGIAPVATYTTDFFVHALPFLIANELAIMLGTWGMSGYRGKVTYLASFPLSLQALWAVIRKRQIKFPVTPKERQEGNFLHLVWPQVAVMTLTFAGLVYAGIRLADGSADYSVGGLIANGFWGLNNILAMSIMVRAAFWKPGKEGESR